MSIVHQSGDSAVFFCPGCKESHRLRVDSDKSPRWSWNGSLDKPTFGPSVLVTTGHYLSTHKPGDECWCNFNEKHPDDPVHFRCVRCHSFVKDGCIEFISDSTHELANQTVDLPDWKTHET